MKFLIFLKNINVTKFTEKKIFISSVITFAEWSSDKLWEAIGGVTTTRLQRLQNDLSIKKKVSLVFHNIISIFLNQSILDLFLYVFD